MAEQREISTQHLNLFISSVQKGFPVLYVESSGMLAVDHPEIGYLALTLADKVVDKGEEKDITNGS